ncbi:MAG: GNAT family N-acetyltransferase [Peptoniphilaceae bacterium]|nr:GNAT family N-acetyltransferase [Peptoniphilaceae bacterium]MDY6018101.1 GNAT family N-acetyltransferase [Anaerococcus sp.]
MEIKLNLKETESQAFDEDRKIGFCQYEIVNENLWDLVHTVVSRAYGGQGIAGKLVDEIVAYARENNIKLIPTCPYVKRKFDKEPEKYEDLIYKK